MGRGAKPKPTVLKLLAGNPGRRPLNENEPRPPQATPVKPEGLSAVAEQHWEIVAGHLLSCGLLTEIDKPAFALYCEAYARWYEANEKIKEHGTVVKAPSGFPVQSPYLGIANRSFDQMTKLLVEFGMTPSSRSRVAVAPTEKAGGTYDKLND